MKKTTNFVENVDFNIKTTNNTVSFNPSHEFGKIEIGPYLPIMSGSYNVDVVSTSDFNIFEIQGHY